MKNIKVLFFGKLKEIWENNHLDLETESNNIEELYIELLKFASSEPFKPSIKVAINDEFCDWSTAIEDGDEIAFLPPASGG
ncbi:MAG: MoaD/ThiS family protein [Gammaproteobacteria bacterium]|jgi:molybdopterin synthase sulfur carrier subunit|nr:MoaD/ThiS family protein [Xanthomonadales bacterium]